MANLKPVSKCAQQTILNALKSSFLVTLVVVIKFQKQIE